MIHNEITQDFKVVSTGYSEAQIETEDGDMILPPGYYMEVEVNGMEFVIPIEQTTFEGISNVLIAERNTNTNDETQLSMLVGEG